MKLLKEVLNGWLIPAQIKGESKTILAKWCQFENRFCYGDMKRNSFLISIGLLALIGLDMNHNDAGNNPDIYFELINRVLPAGYFALLGFWLHQKRSPSESLAFVFNKCLFLLGCILVYTLQFRYSQLFPDRLRIYSPLLIPVSIFLTRIGPRNSMVFFLLCLSIWRLFFFDPNYLQLDLNYFLVSFLFALPFANTIKFASRSVLEQEKRSESEKNLEIQKKQQKETLVKILCHDINNPLTVVNGQLQRIIKNAKNNKATLEDIAERSEKALRCSRVIQHIIQQVNELEALESGKVSLNCEPVRLKEILDSSFNTLSDKIRAKKVSIHCECDESAQVYAEPKSLSNSVINNILSNAIKFVKQNRGKISIKVSKSKSKVCLVIADNGVGMPESIRENLFREDVVTSRPGTSGERGTGFGMPLVKTYMDLYGGNIEVSSREEESNPHRHGTTFTLTFKNSGKGNNKKESQEKAKDQAA